jgi:hypothetical protein
MTTLSIVLRGRENVSVPRAKATKGTIARARPNGENKSGLDGIKENRGGASLGDL